tara:strand:- start:43 stop:465 length:423 start_codon:yes stop_codon:yes gene_type:complete
MIEVQIGKGRIVRSGTRAALLNFGTLLSSAFDAAEKLGATVVDMRFVKPLDEDLIRELAKTHELLVTIEENVVAGGAGAAVSEYLAAAAISAPILHLGILDQFIDHGKHSQQLESVGLDTAGILKKIDARLDLLKVSQKP